VKIIFLSLIFIQFAFSQPTEDIIYLNDGKVVKGKIVSGGNDGDCESNTNDIDGDDWEDMNGNSIDYGIVVGGKYTINKQISLVGTYFFGLANLNDADKGDADELKNRSFQINVSFVF
jgi:hypothetical protein